MVKEKLLERENRTQEASTINIKISPRRLFPDGSLCVLPKCTQNLPQILRGFFLGVR
jgi:hypothetical protein